MLRIDTTNLPPVESVSSARSPTGRDRSISLSQGVLPSFRISSSISQDKSPVSQNLSHIAAAHGTNKARNESRKLLAHVLDQLRNRPMPPSSLYSTDSRLSNSGKGLAAIMRSVTGIAASTGAALDSRQYSQYDDDDDDLLDDSTFTTDETFDLMLRLREVLTISTAQGWNILAENDDGDATMRNDESSNKSSSFLRRKSMQPTSKRSRGRSASPSRRNVYKPPELLSQCISALTSVITNDCRFQVSSPKPSKPPNALQAVTLDVAHFLLHTNRQSPKIVSEIAFSVIHAFYTFRPVMHERLLAFFEDCVVSGMLYSLRQVQARRNHAQEPMIEDDSKPPLVSIQVEEAHDDPVSHEHGWQRWLPSHPSTVGIRSVTAPEQEVSVYYLSAVVPPLLGAILETVDIFSADIPVPAIHRFYHMMNKLIQSKNDVYLDLLAVVAYHSSKARYAAISLLFTYWPKATGHLMISKPFPDVIYTEALYSRPEYGAMTRKAPLRDHSYSHQFVPWRFSSSTRPMLFEGLSQRECRVCNQAIHGFGLICPFCMCSVHFDCYDYPEGSFFTEYSTGPNHAVQKVAVHRFCHVLAFRRNPTELIVRREQHLFRAVNIFSLTLCFLCQKPLWGCAMQGLKCSTCQHFVHSNCLENCTDVPRCKDMLMDSSHVVIQWSSMRRSFADHFSDLMANPTELQNKTYEELSVMHGVLWTQLQLLNNGVALGSIVILDDNSEVGEGKLEEFELHYLVEVLESYLKNRRIPVSDTLSEYMQENRLESNSHLMYFDWNTLAFISSTLKIPSSDTGNVSGYLSAVASDTHLTALDDSQYPFEVIPLAHLRDQLAIALSVFSDAVARHMLSHLHHLGLFQRLDSKQTLFLDGDVSQTLQCNFPLPFGFDVSADIETLVSAVEGSLADLDLSVNEAGLLLLSRRFWPDGMLSEYTFRRLTKAILGWILVEDDSLATILRDYVARGRNLPGVRSGVDIQPWPTHAKSRPTATSASNGGDYVASRRFLLSRYAAPWLLATHDHDVAMYPVLLYDILAEYAEETYSDDLSNLISEVTIINTPKRQAAVSDRILRLITKVSQAGVIFTAFEDIFHRWLSTFELTVQEGTPSLTRLFTRESDAVHRYSTMADSRATVADMTPVSNTNPFTILMQTATVSREGFVNTLNWLCLFVASGIEVPIPIFMQLASLVTQYNASLEECAMLVKATFWSCWQKPLGRQELQRFVALLHSHLETQILEYMHTRRKLSDVVLFLRRTLATCLLLYGCERNRLITLGMVQTEETQHLPSRRKLHSRASAMNDPIVIDSSLVKSLKTYVELKIDEISCLIAKFLNAFVNDASLVESYEVDNFILRNGDVLCTCAWEFYGMEMHEISLIRAALILRILVVDAQPFQTLMSQLSARSNDWTMRLQTVTRLFRMVQDATSPAFNIEDRQWRPSAIDIYYHFFTALWLDEKEEVRSAVETWSQSLLPGHLEAIALCWNEALNKIPVVERIKLVSFLLQLHSHFPTWKVLWWDAIIETLLENDFMQRNGEDDDGAAAAHLSLYGLSSSNKDEVVSIDPDIVPLQVSLISLSLRMIADGVSVDLFSLLKLKSHIARVLGYRDVSLSSSNSGAMFYVTFGDMDDIPEWAFPCLSDLMLALDSSAPMEVSPSAMGGPFANDDTTFPLLVGTAFVDILLDLFVTSTELPYLPAMTLKDLLKAMIIVIYKHDFDSKPLRHLQANFRRAVRRTLELLLDDKHLSYELRQSALSVCQAFIKKWPGIIGNFIIDAIETAVKLLITLQYKVNPDDILVVQTKSFLETTLSMFAMSGVLNAVFKRPHDHAFFEVLYSVLDISTKSDNTRLRESLLRDTLARAIDNDVESFQQVLDNLNQYVEKVYHAQYGVELMQFVGVSLVNIVRKTADWPADVFDPSPLLLLSCTLIQNNKIQCRDLLLHTETVLRAGLGRFHFSSTSINRILQVSASLYRKSDSAEQALSANLIAMALIEVLSDGLHGKARITASTLKSLVDAIQPDGENESYLQLPMETAARLADGGLYYLYTESLDSSSQTAFQASQAVAKMVLRVAEGQPLVLGRLAKSQVAVRAWNIIMLAALSSPSNKAAKILFNHFHAFSLSYSKSLSSYQLSECESQDLVHADISRAYASIKLWLLLSRKAAMHNPFDDVQQTSSYSDESSTSRRVWNELWPPFETVVISLEMDAQVGNLSALASTILSSVADLFLFLRQSRSTVALEFSSQIALLNRLRTFGRNDSKVTRVLRIMNEVPPDSSLEFFVNQVTTEIWAEEKLEAAKRQEMAKLAPESRVRRVVS
ncbi:hypothetical protein C8Q75DRAFT_845203 [Abortiporus biennis]|nr:hypothetical protein C8Q75DRAFT_845203 [Abortiporus biennis]